MRREGKCEVDSVRTCEPGKVFGLLLGQRTYQQGSDVTSFAFSRRLLWLHSTLRGLKRGKKWMLRELVEDP